MNFSNQRYFQVKIRNHVLNIFILENDVPQGSALGIFFLIQAAINDLLSIIIYPINSNIMLNIPTYTLVKLTFLQMTILLQICIDDLTK